MEENGVESIVMIFGSARSKDPKEYQEVPCQVNTPLLQEYEHLRATFKPDAFAPYLRVKTKPNLRNALDGRVAAGIGFVQSGCIIVRHLQACARKSRQNQAFSRSSPDLNAWHSCAVTTRMRQA
eukprot:4699456-Amphidinium_carterae.1